MQGNVKHKKPSRRRWFISRRRAGCRVMANIMAAYVLHRVSEQDGPTAPIDTSPDDGAPAC
jgi:hypothetical protein